MNNLFLVSFNLNTLLFYFIYYKNKSFKIVEEKKLKIKFILFIKEL